MVTFAALALPCNTHPRLQSARDQTYNLGTYSKSQKSQDKAGLPNLSSVLFTCYLAIPPPRYPAHGGFAANATCITSDAFVSPV